MHHAHTLPHTWQQTPLDTGTEALVVYVVRLTIIKLAKRLLFNTAILGSNTTDQYGQTASCALNSLWVRNAEPTFLDWVFSSSVLASAVTRFHGSLGFHYV